MVAIHFMYETTWETDYMANAMYEQPEEKRNGAPRTIIQKSTR